MRLSGLRLADAARYGFDASFNPTYPETSRIRTAWVSPWIFGFESRPDYSNDRNFQSELIWKTVRTCSYIVKGLRRAGFRDGWLGNQDL